MEGRWFVERKAVRGKERGEEGMEELIGREEVKGGSEGVGERNGVGETCRQEKRQGNE